MNSHDIQYITCIGDGKASTQITQGGAGAQPRLSGQGVAVVVSLSTHRTHRLQAEDLTICAHVRRELQRGESGGIIHLDFETGQRVQQRRGGHGDFMGTVVDPLLQGEERPTESPRCGCQIRGS